MKLNPRTIRYRRQSRRTNRPLPRCSRYICCRIDARQAPCEWPPCGPAACRSTLSMRESSKGPNFSFLVVPPIDAELEHTWVDNIRPHDSTLQVPSPRILSDCLTISSPDNGLWFSYLSFGQRSVQAFALPDDFATLRPVCRAGTLVCSRIRLAEMRSGVVRPSENRL